MWLVVVEACGGPPCPPLSVEVVVLGGRALDAARLVRARMSGIENGPEAYYALYSPAGRLAEARRELEWTYREAGYRDAVVAAAETEFAPGDREIAVVFRVAEGRRFRFGTVALEENPEDDGEPVPERTTSAARRALESVDALAPGEWYSGHELDAVTLRVTEIYGNAGYARARVQTVRAVDQEQARVDLVLRVLPGPVYFIDAINVVDSEHGSVRAELGSLSAGSRFARDAAEEARAALQATHPDRRVEYTVDDIPERPGHGILRFTMTSSR